MSTSFNFVKQTQIAESTAFDLARESHTIGLSEAGIETTPKHAPTKDLLFASEINVSRIESSSTAMEEVKIKDNVESVFASEEVQISSKPQDIHQALELTQLTEDALADDEYFVEETFAGQVKTVKEKPEVRESDIQSLSTEQSSAVVSHEEKQSVAQDTVEEDVVGPAEKALSGVEVISETVVAGDWVLVEHLQDSVVMQGEF